MPHNSLLRTKSGKICLFTCSQLRPTGALLPGWDVWASQAIGRAFLDSSGVGTCEMAEEDVQDTALQLFRSRRRRICVLWPFVAFRAIPLPFASSAFWPTAERQGTAFTPPDTTGHTTQVHR